MKIFVVAALAIAFASEAVASDLPFGLWKFPDKQAYVNVFEFGLAFQCRIARDGSVIKALGILKDTSAVEWLPVSITDAHGNAMDAQGRGWGADKIEVNGGRLVLVGKYGRFEFEKFSSTMPEQCR